MGEKKWRTAISWHFDKEAYVRGYKLKDLIGNLTFSQAIYLVLTGELPDDKKVKMMDAILVTMIEHSIAPPSVIAARAVISGGNPIHVGVGAGILAFGKVHGGALEDCMRLFQENIDKNPSDIVEDYFSQGKRIPGYGHRYYKEGDPRTERLFSIAKELGFFGKYCKFALDLEKQIERKKGKKLVLNVDGAVGAVASELGFDWRIGEGLWIVGRIPGLVAHTYEEYTMEKPFSKRLDEEKEVEYIGYPPRELKL